MPTFCITPSSLEERAEKLFDRELRRPVLERFLARVRTEGEGTQTGTESRLTRVLDGLREVFERSSLPPSAQAPLAQLAALFRTNDEEAPIALELAPVPEALCHELARWLQVVRDERIAAEMQRHLELARALDGPGAEALLIEAFEQHLLAPDERMAPLRALEAVRRVHALVEIALLARLHAAWSELERDRQRAFIALDAGQTNHTMVTRWRDLPKTGKFTARSDGKHAEIISPGPGRNLALRLGLEEIPARVIEVIRHWRSWQGLRHWAALQRLFTAAGRTGRIRWNLNDHLEALGLSDRSRRDPKMRQRIAAEVEALTRIEIAVYNKDGSLRLRGPILAVTQRGEALRGSEWALEGLELVIHPVLYEGVRKSTGELGTLWSPAPAELAHLDERTHPHALALGLLLPIRWRWDLDEAQDHLVLTGEKLLETAGIRRPARNPGRAWQKLDRNLRALQEIGGLGRVEWDEEGPHREQARCRLYPPPWIRDRLLHRILPTETFRATALLTGSDLADWRRSLGLTQVALAGQLGLSERTIRRAEVSPDHPLSASLREAVVRFQGQALPAAPES